MANHISIIGEKEKLTFLVPQRWQAKRANRSTTDSQTTWSETIKKLVKVYVHNTKLLLVSWIRSSFSIYMCVCVGVGVCMNLLSKPCVILEERDWIPCRAERTA